MRAQELFLRRIVAAHRAGHILTIDVERAFASACIYCAIACERALEKLFLGLLVGTLKSSLRTVKPLITINSHRVAAAIIRGERRYVDWLPYENQTLKRAEAFFSSGRPFSSLSAPGKTALEDLRVIRNALAHESPSALRTFENRLTRGKNLPPNQTRPAGYLRGNHHGTLTRLDVVTAQALGAMREICK
jgi:hypothetical protein